MTLLILWLSLGLLTAASNQGAGKYAWGNLALWPLSQVLTLPWVFAWNRRRRLVLDRYEREARG